jgi:hypothetical protein
VADQSPPDHLKSARDAERFWTPERLKAAKPLPLPVTGGGKPGPSSGQPPRGRPQAVKGTTGSLKGPRAGGSVAPPHGGPGGQRKAGVELPWNENFHKYASPLAAVGRLFFQESDGRTYTCSGTVVSTNIVLTAAHCVRDGRTGQWNSHWIFYPKVNGTSKPYGGFTARAAFVNTRWAASPYNTAAGTGGGGYFPTDYAFVVLRPNGAGYNVAHYTGAYGFLANPPKATIYDLGYPAEGYWAVHCNSSSCLPWAAQAPEQRYDAYYGGQYDVGASQFNTGGSSGGPWFQQWNGRWYVGAVQSHMGVVHTGGGGRYGYSFFGPYFDGTTVSVFNYAKTH